MKSVGAWFLGWMVLLSASWLAAAPPTPVPGAAGKPSVDPGGAGEGRGNDASPAALEFFEKKIRPLLVDNCYACHSANTNSRGGLRVDDRNGLVLGGGRGPAIVPGNPDASLLIRVVSDEGERLKMPPNKRLPPEQVADLKQWIRDGAAWPPVDLGEVIVESAEHYEQLRREHWAWQPFQAVEPPKVRDERWVYNEIDRFILARLEQAQLTPVADSDRLALLRRVTFDLTGLPPTPEAIDAFVNDASPAAFERVVDGLLASHAFGERWGRHWLDVARYAESTGPSRNVPYPHAWRYRDYVIRAFNDDKPYDQFVREQLAGDLLPAETIEQRDEQRVATGFLALGGKDVNQRFKIRFLMDNIDEQIDTVSRAFLGLTASCARCHDHKFDPIPTTDYYALAGIFASTDLCAGVRNKMGGGGLDYYDTNLLLKLGPAEEPTVEFQAETDRIKQALEDARSELVTLRDTPKSNVPGAEGEERLKAARKKVDDLQLQLVARTDPAANGEVALGVRDGSIIGDTELRVRGEAEKLGPRVPRGFLGVLTFADQPIVGADSSGRLELSQWLTDARNPLPSRVIANRVWQHLFGAGLVQSVDNFGVTGDKPSHPELLDYLAQRLIRDGWSLKRLIRTVALSHAYRLGSAAPETHRDIDPGNRLVWRHTPRRLDAEEIRDAMLAAGEDLQLAPRTNSAAGRLRVVELQDSNPEAKRLLAEAWQSPHRSVYLPLLRGLTPLPLEVFDFAEQGMVTGSRDTTTVATQALYLLNDPFVRRQAQHVATRWLERDALSDSERLAGLYRTILGRPPRGDELERAERYLSRYEALSRELRSGPALAVAGTNAPGERPVTSTIPVAGEGAVNQQAPPPVNNRTPEPLGPKIDEPNDPRLAAWASLCQSLFGSAEFRYLP